MAILSDEEKGQLRVESSFEVQELNTKKSTSADEDERKLVEQLLNLLAKVGWVE